MKRFSKISGMTMIGCDWKGETGLSPCPEQFRSCSLKSIVDRQAELAGWLLGERDTRPASVRKEHGYRTDKLDLCPRHARNWVSFFRSMENRYGS